MIFGITGGTGCGKTTALQAIRELGGIIIDCDAVYHVLLQTDKKMLAAIEKQAAKCGIVQDILLEINIGGEESKSGIAPEELPALLDTASRCEHVRILGLMAVPPVNTDEKINRSYFAAMKRLFDECASRRGPRLEMRWLSMGMSGDFENAILEGANLVRVGTSIFGARDYSK